MWKNYFAKNKNTGVNMVYVGTSQCACAFVPGEVDDILDTSSYNMGTNMQSFDSSFAAIKKAVSNGADKVVLVIDHEMLSLDRSDNFRPDASFIHALNSNVSFWEKIANSYDFMTDDAFLGTSSSVNFLFPWIYNRKLDIAENVSDKLDALKGKATYDSDRDCDGFEYSDEVLESLATVSWEDADEFSKENDLTKLELSEDNEKTLREISKYCKDNGAELIAVVVPYPTYITLYDKTSYIEMHEKLDNLFAEYGYTFVDFNLLLNGSGLESAPGGLDISSYEFALPDFKDESHLNTSGATKFSKLFAEYLEYIV